MKPSLRFALALALAALPATPSLAVLAYATPNTTVSQNFDSLATSGTGLTWTNASTLGDGWYLFNRNNAAITTYQADVNLASPAGSFYSFGGSEVPPDRALGGIGRNVPYFDNPPDNTTTGSEAGYIAFAIKNTTGSPLTGFNLRFDGEQWLRSTSSNSQTMRFQYGVGDIFSDVMTWSQPGDSFHFTSPVVGAGSGSAAAVDGNTAGSVANRGGLVSAAIPNNSTLWLRWVERNDVGLDHGLAIDNFSFTALAAIPEPTAGLLGALLTAVLGPALARRPAQAA